MKEALKLALEALESADWYINQLEMIVYSVDDDGTHENRAKVQAAITAIKEALEQPEQEPVAWMHEWEDGGSVLSLYPRDARLNDQPKSVRPLVYGDTTPPKPEPHNFCARCGKRLIGMAFAAGGVHTCTPPEGGHQ